MLDAAIEGLLALFTLKSIAFLLIGVAFGVSFGFLPGLGGIVAMALLLPFVFGVDPETAMCLLLGAHVATVYNSGITSILFGIPGASKAIALCFDGFPLSQQGQSVRALRATAFAAAIGGLAGVVFLVLAMPLLKTVMLSMEQPEYFILGLWALSLIAVFNEGHIFRGLAAAGLGVLLAYVGQDPISSTSRFTFDWLFLQDGISIPVAFIGLFAIPQMISLYQRGGSISGTARKVVKQQQTSKHQDIRNNKSLIAKSSLFGIFIGVMPGVGATLGNLASYGQTVRSTKNPDPPFREGNIKGVIAPATVLGANEGSELLPTISLGIPGGESSAILLSALIVLGVSPGPEMLTTYQSLVFSIIWIIVIAFIVTTITGYMTAPLYARMTTMSSDRLVPLVIVLCLIGAYSVNQRIEDVVLAVFLGITGYYLRKFHYSLSALAVGLVLGGLLERWLHISTEIYGPFFFVTRPLTLVLTIAVVATVVLPMIRNRGGGTPMSGGTAAPESESVEQGGVR